MESVAEYVKYHPIITLVKLNKKTEKHLDLLRKCLTKPLIMGQTVFKDYTSLPSFLSHFIRKLFIVLIKFDVILAYHLSIKMYTGLPLVI